jgi:hypothetical protein
LKGCFFQGNSQFYPLALATIKIEINNKPKSNTLINLAVLIHFRQFSEGVPGAPAGTRGPISKADVFSNFLVASVSIIKQ